MKQQLPITVFLLLTSVSLHAQTNNSKIDSLIKGYISINKFNGSALVMRDGKKFYEKSYGYQNAATKKLITKHSIFPIRSLTKSFTALLVLKLAEENKLSVEDPISTVYQIIRKEIK